MNRFAFNVALAAVLSLAGCAEPAKKQAYDSELSPRIRTVLLVQLPNQERFTTVRDWFILPGNLGVISLLAAAVDLAISTERVTAALDAKQTRLQDRLNEMLRDGLTAHGYETRTMVLPAADEPGKLLPLLRQHGPADAAVVVALKGSVGWTGTPASPARDRPTADFYPQLSATARAIDLGSGAVLYEASLVYGRADQQDGATCFPPDPKYGFASVDEMVADPARLREGWMAGMRLIADKILTDLKRRPSEG